MHFSDVAAGGHRAAVRPGGLWKELELSRLWEVGGGVQGVDEELAVGRRAGSKWLGALTNFITQRNAIVRRKGFFWSLFQPSSPGLLRAMALVFPALKWLYE